MTDLAGKEIVLCRNEEARHRFVGDHQGSLGQAHTDGRRDAAEEREQFALLLVGQTSTSPDPGLIRAVCPSQNGVVACVSKWARAAASASALMVSHQNCASTSPGGNATSSISCPQVAT